jgi:GNAT superfamily N-acetyltransferase
MVTLVRPDSTHLWSVAEAMVREYAASLNINLDFQDFEHELAHLPVEYGPPRGAFLLALQADSFVGCGAIRPFSESACEMKRLYVSSRNQNNGVGRRLATALIAEARVIGYERMLLDTLLSMASARRLYESLGFTSIKSYRFNPLPGASYMGLDLKD